MAYGGRGRGEGDSGGAIISDGSVFEGDKKGRLKKRAELVRGARGKGRAHC